MIRILMVIHGQAARSFTDGDELELVSRGNEAKTTVN